MLRNTILFVLCLLLPASMSLGAYNVTTLAELEQDVKNNLATSADPYHPDSVLDDFINLACRDLASYDVILKADSVVLATTGAGLHVKGLNEDVLEVFAVFPCTSKASRGLDRIGFGDWGKMGAATQLAEIKYYDVQPPYVTDSIGGVTGSANLWLYAAPSAVDTLVVIYSAEAVELSADDDTTNVPYIFREQIVQRATGLAFARAQEYDKATWWLSLYQQERDRKLLYQKQRILELMDYIILRKDITK